MPGSNPRAVFKHGAVIWLCFHWEVWHLWGDGGRFAGLDEEMYRMGCSCAAWFLFLLLKGLVECKVVVYRLGEAQSYILFPPNWENSPLSFLQIYVYNHHTTKKKVVNMVNKGFQLSQRGLHNASISTYNADVSVVDNCSWWCLWACISRTKGGYSLRFEKTVSFTELYLIYSTNSLTIWNHTFPLRIIHRPCKVAVSTGQSSEPNTQWDSCSRRTEAQKKQRWKQVSKNHSSVKVIWYSKQTKIQHINLQCTHSR